MRRRSLLQALGAAFLTSATAGCFVGAGGGNGLELEQVESFSRYTATQPPEFSDDQSELVESVLKDGQYVTYGYQPFSDGDYIEVDGTFYQVDVTKTGTRQMTRTVLGADQVSEQADDAVTFDTYREPDQEPVVFACRMAIARERRDNDRETDDNRYVVVFRTRSAEDSALLPEPDHPLVTYDDRIFRLWTEERELEEDEFRSEGTTVADTADEYRRAVEDEFVIDLDTHDLSAQQQEIVETAISEGEYTESGSISSEFNALINLLQDEEPRPGSLIKYQGEYYTWRYWHSD